MKPKTSNAGFFMNSIKTVDKMKKCCIIVLGA